MICLMESNYIVVYRSGRDYFPISIFITGRGTEPYIVNSEEDVVDLILKTECPADGAVVCKKTILDFNSYMEDRINLITPLFEMLDEI